MADPGFSRGGGVNPPGGGREPSRGGVNTPNFPENCMKSKEFGRPGGGVRPSRPPLDPPMHLCTGVILIFTLKGPELLGLPGLLGQVDNFQNYPSVSHIDTLL